MSRAQSLSIGPSSSKLNVRTIERNGLSWIDIQQPTEAEMQWLSEKFSFHRLALDDCLSPIQMPKLDDYDTYLFLVMHFPVVDKNVRLTLPAEVDIFVGQSYVITVHNGALQPLVSLFDQCASDEDLCSQVVRRSSGYLLYRILDVVIDYSFPILNQITEKVSDIEVKVFDNRNQWLVRELSLLRRDIIAYRRIIRPETDLLETLERSDYEFLKVDPDVYFGDLADHIRRIGNELEEMKEVVESLSDAHSSLTSHETNQAIRVLTVLSTIMLPLSVVSGLYGMNVHLPLGNSPHAFVGVLGIMGAIAGSMLLFFRSRRWI